MTPVDFSTWRNKYGLTQDEAAEQFRLAVEVVQNWENGATAIPSAVDDFCVIWGRRLRQLDPVYGPLTLVYYDKPKFSGALDSRSRQGNLRRELCVCNASAIARAAVLSRAQHLFDPYILEGHEPSEAAEILWSTCEVDDFLSGKDTDAPTLVNLLRTIATEICETVMPTDGVPNPPTAEQVAAHRAKLEAKAQKLNQIAKREIIGDISAGEIETILAEVKKLGSRLRDSHVTGVFRALSAMRQTKPVRRRIGLPTAIGMAGWRLRLRA
jgi:hypothetical protein